MSRTVERHGTVVPARRRSRTVRGILIAGALLVTGITLSTPPLFAQGFKWPWEDDDPRPRPPPIPREPVYRDSEPGAPLTARGWAPARDICLELEQRLVQEGKRGNQSRDLLPAIDAEIRTLRQSLQQAEDRLERSNCYSYFLFSKSLKRTGGCLRLANEAESVKRRLADLEGQRQQFSASAGQSYQDDIIRELARNNCGSNYEQEARKRDRNPFAALWQDGESTGYGGAFGSYNTALPYATYRTLCVRLCDGYYFPISFSTLPNHFGRDAARCQSKCAAPAQLFYYQNPGGAVDQMVSTETNQPYNEMKTAFRYRKEYVPGCSCKTSEYVPQTPVPARQGGVEQAPRQAEGPSVGEGWSVETNQQ